MPTDPLAIPWPHPDVPHRTELSSLLSRPCGQEMDLLPGTSAAATLRPCCLWVRSIGTSHTEFWGAGRCHCDQLGQAGVPTFNKSPQRGHFSLYVLSVLRIQPEAAPPFGAMVGREGGFGAVDVKNH